jgi:hypothetical protein
MRFPRVTVPAEFYDGCTFFEGLHQGMQRAFLLAYGVEQFGYHDAFVVNNVTALQAWSRASARSAVSVSGCGQHAVHRQMP